MRSSIAILSACLAAFAPGAGLAQSMHQESPPSASPASPQDLDTLLAPIALYPDALIAQVLQCASSPFQVKQVSDWLRQNPDLKGTAAQHAAAEQGFDDVFVAIVLFPDVLFMLADRPDWTRQLGQAFTTNRDGAMASVQRLRAQARTVGNLKSTAQQQVETVAVDGGQQVIVIQPANPQVVYVPQYDPQTVYTQPAPAASSNDSTGTAIAAGLIGFAAGVIVGAAADDDDDYYYYSYGGWAYPRPVCYPGGWNNYYEHRENMANDYYQHREDMAGQRGENQATRQESAAQRQTTRQDSRSSAQKTASGSQASRQASRSQAQATAGQARTTAQTSRQAAAAQWQSSAQANRTAASRGSFQNASRASDYRSGTSSGAFSGYQRGSTERASSARGQQSMSRSAGGYSRGGGHAGGGGKGGRR